MVGFSGILDTEIFQVEDILDILSRRSLDDERQVNGWKKIVSRFRGKLVKMIKNAGRKFDDYSIFPNIR